MPVAKTLFDMLMRQREDEATATYRDPKRPLTQNFAADLPAVDTFGAAGDHMPLVNHFDDGLTAVRKASDISAYAERGEDIPSWLFTNQTPEALIEALGTGGQLRALGGEPSTTFMTRPQPPANVTSPVFVEPPTEEDVRMKNAGAVDEFVQKHGYQADMFKGRSAEKAAQIISDQLRARREAVLGPAGNAWLGAFTTDI